MLDVIIGPVTEVIDGDTFKMQVARIGKHNKYNYGGTEPVRIEGINKPELNTKAGVIAKRTLQMKLLGHSVRCDVVSRDVYGRVVAKVTIN